MYKNRNKDKDVIILNNNKQKITYTWRYIHSRQCYFVWYYLAKYFLFSHSVVSDSSWSHGLQHTRLPCPSLPPGVCSNSCPLSWWCHPAISFSVIPFSFCLQSFPAWGSNWLFASGGQNIEASASASVLPMNIQGWFPSGLTCLISLLSKGLSRVFSHSTIQKHQFFGNQPSL